MQISVDLRSPARDVEALKLYSSFASDLADVYGELSKHHKQVKSSMNAIFRPNSSHHKKWITMMGKHAELKQRFPLFVPLSIETDIKEEHRANYADIVAACPSLPYVGNKRPHSPDMHS